MEEQTGALAGPPEKKRIYLLDELRGLAIVLMVAFHAFFTAGYEFDIYIGRFFYNFFSPAQGFFAGLFIVLCGISCRLSHNNLKRGLVIAGGAAAVSLVLWIALPHQMIWFGILHFLAASVLLFVPLRRLLDKVPPLAGLIACAVLALLTHWVPPPGYGESFFGIKGLFEIPVPESWKQPWLYPLGFGYVQGSDYFPMLPWFFIFLAGTFVGVWAKAGKFPAWTYKNHLPPLSLVGRHTLIVYILHQPVVYGALWLVSLIL